ncbi:uncharacterized domain 1-containing protein [Enhydrobacter aerosaccus]|uniref:Uncharacterized domain 1-containing protein n=1 Tax=Enhydrobacter aerosaccus TaxID=225324 RepID=A0A1T4JUJ9_9HYPH|nr:PaaI family thioesterase [Enhydrobacter aerosaccus]SJZ33747.1 uncharacterized domain 1-containing protein [Enhydrobacter aerosaccus]
MTEDTLLAALRAVNDRAAFNRWAGFTVAQAAPGEAELTIEWREAFGQYAGFLHAGLIGALLDTACGFAAFTEVGPVLASHFAVNCLAPAVGRRFVARGRVVKAGRKQVFTTAELLAARDDRLDLVATGEALLVPVPAASKEAP